MATEPEIISVGSKVEVILRDRQGREERLAATIVTDDAADYTHGFLGQSTPLAQALMGERVGTVIPYLKDDIYSIEIVAATKSELDAPKDAAIKRQAALNKAARAVEDTNAMVFASSFSGKWGDYDPDSIPKEEKPDEEEKSSGKKAESKT